MLSDLFAEMDVNRAYQAICDITGDEVSDDILNEVFVFIRYVFFRLSKAGLSFLCYGISIARISGDKCKRFSAIIYIICK